MSTSSHICLAVGVIIAGYRDIARTAKRLNQLAPGAALQHIKGVVRRLGELFFLLF
jgi:hypothetical protein